MRKRSGFSLLELILAIAIFSVSSIAIAVILIDTNLSTKLNLERTEALLYAREGLEAAQSIKNNIWSDLADGNHGLDASSSPWAFHGLSDIIKDKYTRVINVESESSSTKDVSVNISWALTPSRIASTTLMTVMTNWRNN